MSFNITNAVAVDSRTIRVNFDNEPDSTRPDTTDPLEYTVTDTHGNAYDVTGVTCVAGDFFVTVSVDPELVADQLSSYVNTLTIFVNADVLDVDGDPLTIDTADFEYRPQQPYMLTSTVATGAGGCDQLVVLAQNRLNFRTNTIVIDLGDLGSSLKIVADYSPVILVGGGAGRYLGPIQGPLSFKHLPSHPFDADYVVQLILAQSIATPASSGYFFALAPSNGGDALFAGEVTAGGAVYPGNISGGFFAYDSTLNAGWAHDIISGHLVRVDFASGTVGATIAGVPYPAWQVGGGVVDAHGVLWVWFSQSTSDQKKFRRYNSGNGAVIDIVPGPNANQFFGPPYYDAENDQVWASCSDNAFVGPSTVRLNGATGAVEQQLDIPGYPGLSIDWYFEIDKKPGETRIALLYPDGTPISPGAAPTLLFIISNRTTVPTLSAAHSIPLYQALQTPVSFRPDSPVSYARWVTFDDGSGANRGIAFAGSQTSTPSPSAIGLFNTSFLGTFLVELPGTNDVLAASLTPDTSTLQVTFTKSLNATDTATNNPTSYFVVGQSGPVAVTAIGIGGGGATTFSLASPLPPGVNFLLVRRELARADDGDFVGVNFAIFGPPFTAVATPVSSTEVDIVFSNDLNATNQLYAYENALVASYAFDFPISSVAKTASNTIRLTLSAPMVSGSSYTAVVVTAWDIYGVPFPPPGTLPFTVPLFAVTGAAVVSSTTVDVTFSANLSGAPANTDALSYVFSGGFDPLVAASATLIAPNVVRLTTTTPLEAHVLYTVTVSPLVADVFGVVGPTPATATFEIDPVFYVADVRATSENVIRFVFNLPVYFSGLLDAHDASVASRYEVTNDPSTTGLDGQPCRPVSPVSVRLGGIDDGVLPADFGTVVYVTTDRTMSPFPAVYRARTTGVYSVSDDPIYLGPRRSIFGLKRFIEQPNLNTGVTSRDIHNPQTLAGLLDPVPDPGDPLQLGTIVYDETGDVGFDEGLVSYRKRVLRRLVTKKNGFVHLVGYGVGIGDYGKRLALTSVRDSLAAEAERQIALEPETAQVSVTIGPTNKPNLYRLNVKARTRTGQNVGMSLLVRGS